MTQEITPGGSSKGIIQLQVLYSVRGVLSYVGAVYGVVDGDSLSSSFLRAPLLLFR